MEMETNALVEQVKDKIIQDLCDSNNVQQLQNEWSFHKNKLTFT